ncbi:MAG: thioesterase family protein [Acidimicrobiia bacterium]|nr:thioesterase family protein [Acidimicrobiia bacterium]
MAELLDLVDHGPDTFVGVSAPTPWGRVYGGQVVAQGLRAAAATVEGDVAVHSVRAYFIRGGELSEPIRFEVDRIRNGRSFATRRVVARQSSGAILNLDASFQAPEDRADVQVVAFPDDVPGPEESEPTTWSDLHERRIATVDLAGGRLVAWQRVPGPHAPGWTGAACALAWASDDVPMGAARTVHPVAFQRGPNPAVAMSASLDHAVWFHRPHRADEWLLYDLRAQNWVGGRGLAFGHVFTAEGVHVASVAQEVLVRERGDGAPSGAEGV